MARDKITDDVVDGFLSEAHDVAPGPDLMARVLADADAVQAAALEPAIAAPVLRGTWFARLVETLGGWGAVSGVTAAGVMGLALGLYTPDTVAGWIGTETFGLSAGTYDMTPDMTGLWVEGDDV